MGCGVSKMKEEAEFENNMIARPSISSKVDIFDGGDEHVFDDPQAKFLYPRKSVSSQVHKEDERRSISSQIYKEDGRRSIYSETCKEDEQRSIYSQVCKEDARRSVSSQVHKEDEFVKEANMFPAETKMISEFNRFKEDMREKEKGEKEEEDEAKGLPDKEIILEFPKSPSFKEYFTNDDGLSGRRNSGNDNETNMNSNMPVKELPEMDNVHTSVEQELEVQPQPQIVKKESRVKRVKIALSGARNKKKLSLERLFLHPNSTNSSQQQPKNACKARNT